MTKSDYKLSIKVFFFSHTTVSRKALQKCKRRGRKVFPNCYLWLTFSSEFMSTGLSTSNQIWSTIRGFKLGNNCRVYIDIVWINGPSVMLQNGPSVMLVIRIILFYFFTRPFPFPGGLYYDSFQREVLDNF